MCENLRESCEPTLEVCVKLLGYVEYNFEYPEPAQTDRNHNNVFRVTVNGKTSDGEMVSQDLVIKYKGSNQDEIAKIKTTNEKYFYDALKPILENLQRDIPNLSSALFPQTVYTSKDFIILKDVTSSGDYVPVDFDCNEGADFEHIAILIGEMAKLHAVSLGWKERDSENFEKIASKLENIYLRPSLLYFIQEETMVEVLEAIEDQTVKERVKVISDYIVEKFKEIMKPSKYCVICHGNFRFENSFFIYDEVIIFTIVETLFKFYVSFPIVFLKLYCFIINT